MPDGVDSRSLNAVNYIHKDDRKNMLHAYALAERDNAKSNVKFRVVRDDGEIRYCTGSVAIVKNAEGIVIREIVVIKDETEDLKKKENARQNEKLTMLGELAGGVAHDFNNILQIIGGRAELLEFDDEDKEENLSIIKSAASTGHSLIGKILTMSQMQTLEASACDINRLIVQTLPMLSASVSNDVLLRFDQGHDLKPVLVDSAQLQVAIINLGINARDALDNKGEIVIRTKNITNTDVNKALCQDGLLELSISDNGSGMSEKQMEKVLEPFYTTKAAGSGTGLGLSMVNGFIKQSGGDIQIVSELGRGTRVNLYIPYISS